MRSDGGTDRKLLPPSTAVCEMTVTNWPFSFSHCSLIYIVVGCDCYGRLPNKKYQENTRSGDLYSCTSRA